MATFASLKQNVKKKHNELIQALERNYERYISQLIKQKARILLKLQRQMYRELEIVCECEKQCEMHNENQANTASYPPSLSNYDNIPRFHDTLDIHSSNNNDPRSTTANFDVLQSVNSDNKSNVMKVQTLNQGNTKKKDANLDIKCVCGCKLIKTNCSDLCVQSKYHLICNECKKQITADSFVYHCKKRNKRAHKNLPTEWYDGYDVCCNCAEKKWQIQKKKIWKCTYCPFSCERKHELDLHSKQHAAEKALECSICHKRMRSKGGLKNHMRVHSKK